REATARRSYCARMPDLQRDSTQAGRHRRFDLVICDIDGCLAPESTAPIDLASLARVAAYNRRAYETGEAPPLTLCSGRPQPFAEAMCRMIDVRQPCVCENGAWVYERSANRYEL